MRLTTRAFPLVAAGILLLTGCAGEQADTARTDATTAAPTSTASSTASTTAPTTTATTAGTATSDAPDHPSPVPRVAATSDGSDEAAPFTTERVQQQPAPGTELTVTDVRVGSHDGFDRVVIEYSGTGTPGFHAGYVDQARQQASGHPLDVAGPAHLEVMIHGTPMGLISPREDLVTVGPMNLSAGAVQGVTHGGVFEADSQYVIGLDAQKPYRVYTLNNPARVVVDIQR